MADQFTGSVALANQIVTAYDRVAYMALRSGAVFDQWAKVKPGNVTSPGTPVSFLFWNDLSPATTPLAETIDVDAVALSDSTLTITPEEFGNAILLTLRAQTDTFVVGFDGDVANILSFNLLDSMEYIAVAALDAGGTAASVGGVDTTDTMSMSQVRQQVARLRAANVMPAAGQLYPVIMHPDVMYDLMSSTEGEGSWASFHIRQNDGDWYAGEAGRAAGAVFIESPRATIVDAGGSGSTDAYTSYFLGAESFAKAESIPPHIVPGPITDKLRRFVPLGWHAYLQYKVFRSVALRRLISASSIGDNS